MRSARAARSIARRTALALIALGAVARAQSRDASPAEEIVRALPAVARDAADFAALERAVRAHAHAPDVTVTALAGSARVLRIAFATPVRASRVASLLGVAHPYASSGDAHQQSWQLVERTGTVPDANATRLATSAPRAGRWELRVQLAARPVGALPREVTGASPAYDLTRYPATVIAIDIASPP